MDRIPNFKLIKEKTFEAHPVFLTKGKIDLLSEYNFIYISLGVQSFNKGVLKH